MVGTLYTYGRARLSLIDDLDGSSETYYVLIDPEANRPELSTTGKINEVCMWLYTNLELLTQSCGDGQPYTTVTPTQLIGLAQQLEVTVLVAIDVQHPAGARYRATSWEEIEPLDPIPDDVPADPVVWIPTRPVQAGDREVVAELHGTRPGENLLLAFSTPEEAWEACGPYQPLSAVRTDEIDAVAAECGASAVITNGWLDESARHQAPVRDWTRKNRKSAR